MDTVKHQIIYRGDVEHQHEGNILRFQTSKLLIFHDAHYHGHGQAKC